MHMAMPRRKTISAQFGPAVLAIALVALSGFVIPVADPVEITEGTIVPQTGRPGEIVRVEWTQEWRHLCSITVTREFVGADGFRTTAVRFEIKPPAETGTLHTSGKVQLPALPPGQAYYHADIEPHCLMDNIWQRKYRTPDVGVLMLPPLPQPGPR